MAQMAVYLPYIAAAASIGSTIVNASAQEEIAQIESAQLKKQAIADTAMSIQDAKQEKRRSEFLQSRVTALAAKSGTSGLDIDRAISDIDEQGQYNALAALYSGATSASSKKYAASAAIARGKSQINSGYLDAAGTILSTMDQYG